MATKTKSTKKTSASSSAYKTKEHAKLSTPLAAMLILGIAGVIVGVIGLITYFVLSGKGVDVSEQEPRFIVPRISLSIGMLLCLIVAAFAASTNTEVKKSAKKEAFEKTAEGKIAKAILWVCLVCSVISVIAIIISPVVTMFGVDVSDGSLFDSLTTFGWWPCFYVIFYESFASSYDPKKKK